MGNEKTTLREEKLAKSLTSRLNRIEGQIRGIKGMIEKDSYCDDVLNQIAAARSALNAVGVLVLESHMRQCFAEKVKNGEDEIIDELITTINRIL